jgi:hypothetical protein
MQHYRRYGLLPCLQSIDDDDIRKITTAAATGNGSGGVKLVGDVTRDFRFVSPTSTAAATQHYTLMGSLPLTQMLYFFAEFLNKFDFSRLSVCVVGSATDVYLHQVDLCSLLCCSLGSVRALVTFICVLFCVAP